MADLTVQEISQTGLNPSFAAAAAGGDSYLNDDRTFFVIKNADASSHTVTLTAQRTTFEITGFGTVTFSDIVVAVPASEERWIKAPPAVYNDGNGKVQATYDAVTSITVGVIKMPGN
ncbi:MAG: hypothetical protein GWN01_09210 [Nitrosopumilaceae archaeon]|nr:hypothetical protein [Nitrosopumilaceae archaeon]NIU87788.1 hypothetical protein [Nitrosopumilaceae archaeon]NIV65171.1 hypothetical protein [Nitrosopumilaceae archaeon]NIX61686.1 hypothetical protein [Nitrosopumilaceae archaeon]